MSAAQLTRVPGTALYQPPKPADGYALFLRWSTAAPPQTLPIEQTWSDDGAPAEPGWWAFTDAGSAPTAATEQALRAALPAPAGATGFAWLGLARGSPVKPTIAALAPDGHGRPAFPAAVPVALPPGVYPLGFPAGAPVHGGRDGDGALVALVVDAPDPGAEPSPPRPGAAVPLVGDNAGVIAFTGFVPTTGGRREGTEPGVVKALVAAQTDPVRPFDPKRTSIAPTGREMAFVPDGGGWRLVPLNRPGTAA